MKNETFTPERIKAEADTFFEWDGEDRSLVTTTSCLLFAQHIAGLMQARAAQPAPVVPAECADLNHHERYRAGWNACRAAMLAAAPAQGQQVEWRTTAVMLEQANAGLAQLNGKLRAELSALKAQQEPVAWRVTGAGGLTVTPEYPKWAEDDSRLLIESLYTAPQPAPAQDVAGEDGERTQSAPVSQAERHPLESLEPLKRPVPSGWAVKRSDASRHEFYGFYDEYLGPLDGWLQDPRRAVLFGNKEAAIAAQAALSVGSKLAISVVWLVYDPVFDTYREQAQ